MKNIIQCLVATVGLAGLAVAAQANTITLKGSDTMVILAQKWAETYMSQNPKVRVQVTGGGSGVGLAALQNQTTDLAASSRKIRGKEIEACLRNFGRRPTEYRVALDGIMVFVHESNPVKEMTLEQLQRIFTGRARNWKEFGGPDARIILYSRENSSGTYEFFKEHVLMGRDFHSSVLTMPGTASVVAAVAKDRNAIGYGGAGYGAGAKHLAIKRDENSPAIDPTEETVVKGTYPIWRYLHIYVNPALDKGPVADFLKWIRSEAGQKVVKDIGFYPLPERLRGQ